MNGLLMSFSENALHFEKMKVLSDKYSTRYTCSKFS